MKIKNYNFHLMWKRWSYKGDPLSRELCNLWFPMFKTRTVQDIFIKPWVKILIGKNNLNVKFLICLFCSPVTMKILHIFHGASKICIAHTYEALNSSVAHAHTMYLSPGLHIQHFVFTLVLKKLLISWYFHVISHSDIYYLELFNDVNIFWC